MGVDEDLEADERSRRKQRQDTDDLNAELAGVNTKARRFTSDNETPAARAELRRGRDLDASMSALTYQQRLQNFCAGGSTSHQKPHFWESAAA